MKRAAAHSSALALADVIKERDRQRTKEGYTPDHDDTHVRGELARGAAAYAMLAGIGYDPVTPEMRARHEALWPFDEPMKPRGPRSNAVRACAMLLAEIERIDRAAGREVVS